MFRKTVVLVVVMLLALASFTYALGEDNSVQLVSPQVDDLGQVKRASTLNITLELTGDINAYLQLVRIDSPDMPFVSEEVLEAINYKARRAPTAWLSQDLFAPENYDPSPKIEVEAYYQSDMSDDDLRAVYVAQGDRVIASSETYVQAYYKARQVYQADELERIVAERQLIANDLIDLYIARNDYEKQAILFFILQDKYNSRFRYTVVSQVPVAQYGPLPYFNYAVSDIEPAKYEITVRDGATDDLLMPIRRFIVVD